MPELSAGFRSHGLFTGEFPEAQSGVETNRQRVETLRHRVEWEFVEAGRTKFDLRRARPMWTAHLAMRDSSFVDTDIHPPPYAMETPVRTRERARST